MAGVMQEGSLSPHKHLENKSQVLSISCMRQQHKTKNPFSLHLAARVLYRQQSATMNYTTVTNCKLTVTME
jgi:hypothetical protein